MKLQELLGTLLAMIILVPTKIAAQEDEIGFFWADTVTVEAQRAISIPRLSAVATKMLIPLHSTPAAIGVVTRSVFETQKAVTLRDALKNISGVNVADGPATFDFFLIRGFESLSGGMVLTDGAAEPEVGFYNLYNIERVEVLKGPAAFLYGGNPLSGTVNLVRKQPVFANFANFSGSYGDFQAYRGTFDVGVSDPRSKVAFRLNGLWQDTENYRDGKENKAYAVNPALTWKIDQRSALTLNFEYVNSQYRPDSGLPLQMNPLSATPSGAEDFDRVIPRVSRRNSYQTPLDDSDQEQFRVRLDYNRELSQSVAVRNKFYFTRLDWLSRGTLFTGAFPNAQGAFGVQRSLSDLDDDQKFVGNQLEAIISYTTGGVEHNLLAGLETARQGDKFGLDVFSISPIDLFNPVETTTSPDHLQFVVQTNSGDARSWILAPYVLNRASFSEKVQLFLGGRFDIIDYADNRTDGSFNPATFGIDLVSSQNSRSYKRLSPMLGLVVAPTPSVSLYANAGQSFGPPSVLTRDAPKAEESTQIEFGTKIQSLGGKLTTNLAIYRLKRENIGIPDQTGITQQTGTQRSTGVEIEVALQPIKDWHTFVNYAFTDAELTEFTAIDFIAQAAALQAPPGTIEVVQDYSGNRASFSPKHIINFWTTKQFDMGLGLGGGWRYVSDQFISEDNLFKTGDYVTFDAAVYYTFRNLRWSLNIKNIADVDYESRAGFPSVSVIPADPRAVYGSIDLSL